MNELPSYEEYYGTLLDKRGVPMPSSIPELSDHAEIADRRRKILAEKLGAIAESWIDELAEEANGERRLELLGAIDGLISISSSIDELYG